MAALELEDIWYRYAGDPALQGVTLSIHRHELVALVGRNGAGAPAGGDPAG